VEDSLPPDQREVIRSLHEPSRQLIGRRVLVVDDDARNLFALSRILTGAGMVVDSATNGKMGVDKLQAPGGFDVVLMDVMMPVMDGLEAIRLIRGMAQLRDLPVIALTAKAMKKDHQECLAAGASDYLAKPIDAEQLLALLRVWLARVGRVA
jgi:CheY-like chemotaxis protein